jgi:HK97 family phage major capsid protein/HK97 family phage prohead protease
MADFRCGPARDLPLKDGVAFDRSGAIASMLDAANIGGDNPDFAKAKRGFLIYDADKPELRGSYHLPFATMVNGTLTAIGNGVRNAASRLPQMNNVPADVEAAARRVLDGYMAKIHADDGKGVDDDEAIEKQAPDDGKIYRAYSILTVKDLNEDERVIHGTATTPTPDRMGDIVEPLGITYKNPLPLLWQHDSDKPIGLVTFDPPNTKGVRFAARLPKVTEPGILKDRIDEAWQSVRYGLVAGASIGFRAMKDGTEYRDEGGIRFKKTEVMELSLVTIPANNECTIATIKSLDRKSAAALGNKRSAVILNRPGAAGISATSKPEAYSNMKTIAEQITALEGTRVAKAARMNEIMQAPMNEGRSTDAAEAEEFDTLEQEVEAVDRDLKRLRVAEKMNAQHAKAVVATTSTEASASRGGQHIVVKQQEKLPPGIGFAQLVKCIAAGRGNLMQAAEMSRHIHGDQSDVTRAIKDLSRIGTSNNLSLIERAAAPGATTTDSDWAGPLVFPFPRLASEFVEFLRPLTILGRIPGMTQIPFNVNIAAQTSGSTAGWVGEGKAKPVSSFGFTSVNFRWAKIAAILVQTEELMRFSSPSSDMLFRNELARAIAERQDLDFLDPANAGTANVKPASVTNGVAPIVSTGNDADHVRLDLENLLATFDAVNISLTNPVFVMSMTKARALSLMRTALGTREFPDINLMGMGSIEGIPVVSSQYVTRFGTTGGEYIVLLNAEDIWFADDGQVTIDASREASLQMDDAPTEESSGGTGASMVSMFQTNSVALRGERYVNWQKRRAQAVAVLGNVFWGHSAVSGT